MSSLEEIFNLAYMSHQAGHFAHAAELYRSVLQVDPDHFDSLHLLGLIVGTEGNNDLACEYLRQALRVKPGSAVAHFNLGIILRKQGKLDEAVASYLEAIRLDPNYTQAHCNLGMLWLLRGNFEQGWPEFEWRQELKWLGFRSFPQPRWDGSHLDGKTIMLHGEQGLGLTLQFVRYAPLVKQFGGSVLLESPADLAALLYSCDGIDQILHQGVPLPPFDVQAPLMSLPAILKTTLATVPAFIPYLRPDPARTQAWREELNRYSGFKIGIAWQGDPRHYQPNFTPEDRARSIPLAHFETLVRLPGVRFFSLQKGYGTEQLAQWGAKWGIVELGDRLHDFMETAAVMMNLDLIISADTSPVHLAGALGRNVWTILPCDASWRWLLHRQDSPWYPTMRLFRQQQPGDWPEVFARVARELQQRVNSP